MLNGCRPHVGAFSVIVKTGCGTDGSFYSTNNFTQVTLHGALSPPPEYRFEGPGLGSVVVEPELRHESGGGDGEHVAVGEARGQQEGGGRQRVLVLQRVARHLGVTARVPQFFCQQGEGALYRCQACSPSGDRVNCAMTPLTCESCGRGEAGE